MQSSPLLEIRDLNVSFHTSAGTVKACDGINLIIREKESLCLIGESGCGKSVVALSILNLLPNNAIVEGEVIFKGRDLLSLDDGDMRKIRGHDISMVFEQPATCLNPVFSIGEQIAEAVRIHEALSKISAREKAIRLMELVGISPARYHEYPHQFSGGMQQRVMIAMALAFKPALIIADEPTTSLDLITQAQILDLLKRISQEIGTSLFMITHDLGVAWEICDSVAVMYAGELVERACIQEFFQSPMHPYSRALLGAISDSCLNPISGSVPNLTKLPSGCRFHPRCSQCSDICKKVRPEMKNRNSREVMCHFRPA
jgi:peptide/nickel transport system ATP-binding protein